MFCCNRRTLKVVQCTHLPVALVLRILWKSKGGHSNFEHQSKDFHFLSDLGGKSHQKTIPKFSVAFPCNLPSPMHSTPAHLTPLSLHDRLLITMTPHLPLSFPLMPASQTTPVLQDLVQSPVPGGSTPQGTWFVPWALTSQLNVYMSELSSAHHSLLTSRSVDPDACWTSLGTS